MELAKLHEVYLLQCGNERCESVQYETKKIQAIQADEKNGTKVAPEDVLVRAFSDMSYQDGEEKAKGVAREYVTIKQPTVPEEVMLTLALSSYKKGKKSLS